MTNAVVETEEVTPDAYTERLMKQAEEITVTHGNVLLHVLKLIEDCKDPKKVAKLTEAYAMLVARVPVVHRMIANKCDHHGNSNPVQHIDASAGHYI